MSLHYLYRTIYKTIIYYEGFYNKSILSQTKLCEIYAKLTLLLIFTYNTIM